MHRTAFAPELLESRRLLSTVAIDARGMLRVIGDEDVNDVISVGVAQGGQHIFVTMAGKDDQVFELSKVNKIIVHGLGGDDEIFVDEANGQLAIPVRMYGGAGDDDIKGGAEDNQLFGGAGNDKLDALDGRNLVDGGADDDEIRGGGLSDTLYGGAGNDLLLGFAGKDFMFGGAGNDELIGFEDDDVMSGGSGNDSLYGSGGNDTMVGGAGNDLLEGEDGDDLILGVAGKDSLLGGEGNDSLWGGDKGQKDLIDGGAGANVTKRNHFASKNGRLMKLVKQIDC